MYCVAVPVLVWNICWVAASPACWQLTESTTRRHSRTRRARTTACIVAILLAFRWQSGAHYSELDSLFTLALVSVQINGFSLHHNKLAFTWMSVSATVKLNITSSVSHHKEKSGDSKMWMSQICARAKQQCTQSQIWRFSWEAPLWREESGTCHLVLYYKGSWMRSACLQCQHVYSSLKRVFGTFWVNNWICTGLCHSCQWWCHQSSHMGGRMWRTAIRSHCGETNQIWSIALFTFNVNDHQLLAFW